MKYQLTFKQFDDVRHQTIEDGAYTLNLIRKMFVVLGDGEETLADIQAVNLLNQIDAGQPKALENPSNGASVHIQHVEQD